MLMCPEIYKYILQHYSEQNILITNIINKKIFDTYILLKKVLKSC